MYYHATPGRNLEAIARHGLLSGSRALELGAGELTTGRKDGAPYIHVTDHIEKCVRWFRQVSGFAERAPNWYIVRFDPSGLGVEVRPDPRSSTGLILKTDCIPVDRLSYRFGEDYEPGQGEEIAGVNVWSAMSPRPA